MFSASIILEWTDFDIAFKYGWHRTSNKKDP